MRRIAVGFYGAIFDVASKTLLIGFSRTHCIMATETAIKSNAAFENSSNRTNNYNGNKTNSTASIMIIIIVIIIIMIIMIKIIVIIMIIIIVKYDK